MKNTNPLQEYISRLLHQTGIVITGIFGFLIAFITDVFYPSVNARIIYIVVFIGAVIIGSYNVFKDLLEEHKVLQIRIRELEEKKPNIIVGFLDQSNHLSKNLKIDLYPLPPEPDFENLVNKKHKELLNNGPDNRDLVGLGAMSVFYQPNPNYNKEVEIYIQEYREYLIQNYEAGVDRAYKINIVIDNKGSYPANNVSVELSMPKAYKPPLEHQSFDRKTTLKEQINYFIHMPIKPEAYTNPTDVFLSMNRLDYDLQATTNSNQYSNLSGPNIENKDGDCQISYTAQKIIQHKPEKDFEPFWIWLGSIEQSTIWEIPIKVTCAELREPLTDILFLDIRINRQAEESLD
jgi:hypothetical protein